MLQAAKNKKNTLLQWPFFYLQEYICLMSLKITNVVIVFGGSVPIQFIFYFFEHHFTYTFILINQHLIIQYLTP